MGWAIGLSIWFLGWVFSTRTIYSHGWTQELKYRANRRSTYDDFYNTTRESIITAAVFLSVIWPVALPAFWVYSRPTKYERDRDRAKMERQLQQEQLERIKHLEETNKRLTREIGDL